MKLDVFLAQLKTSKTDEAKANVICSHIKYKYVPIQQKIKYAEYIASKCILKDKDTGDVRVNSIVRYILSNFGLIELYTDLELNRKDIYNEYDKLNMHNLFVVFTKAIDENEVEEFSMIVDMCFQDKLIEYDNN